MEIIWNPWHGCKKISEGCKNCYVYFLDKQRNPNIDSSITNKTNNFNLPLKKNRQGEYKILSGTTVFTCLTSDFFIKEADDWRMEIWNMIKLRPDLTFHIITKRVDRINECLPADWGKGYSNVILDITCENQKRVDERLPVILKIPGRKAICVAPILEEVNIENYLKTNQFEFVSCGGENYEGARITKYDWIKSLSDQCKTYNTTFTFFETGCKFEMNGKIYNITNKATQKQQALFSGLSFTRL